MGTVCGPPRACTSYPFPIRHSRSGYLAGILVLGPARAGVYNYLQPLFVAILAVPLLGEEIRWFHPIAFALVVAGILVSSRARSGR